MENAPVINLASTSPAPWVDSETWNRFQKWLNEVYTPVLWMNIPGVTGSDRYHIVKENPAYPLNVTIRHLLSLNDWESSLKSRDRIAINSEMNSWVKRRVVDWILSTSFQLLKSFRSEPARDDSNNDTKIENGPVMHLETFHQRKEDEEK